MLACSLHMPGPPHDPLGATSPVTPSKHAAGQAVLVLRHHSSLRLCNCFPQALSGIFLGIGGGSAANRQYFIRAEQLIWDFAPDGQYMCDEVPRPFNDAEVSLHITTAPSAETQAY